MGSELAKAGDQVKALDHQAGADTDGRTGAQDLLGSSAADAKQGLDLSAIDPGGRELLEFLDESVYLVAPSRFSGHGSRLMLVRECAKYQQFVWVENAR
jgi:hypothetical protein